MQPSDADRDYINRLVTRIEHAIVNATLTNSPTTGEARRKFRAQAMQLLASQFPQQHAALTEFDAWLTDIGLQTKNWRPPRTDQVPAEFAYGNMLFRRMMGGLAAASRYRKGGLDAFSGKRKPRKPMVKADAEVAPITNEKEWVYWHWAGQGWVPIDEAAAKLLGMPEDTVKGLRQQLEKDHIVGDRTHFSLPVLVVRRRPTVDLDRMKELMTKLSQAELEVLSELLEEHAE